MQDEVGVLPEHGGLGAALEVVTAMRDARHTIAEDGARDRHRREGGCGGCTQRAREQRGRMVHASGDRDDLSEIGIVARDGRWIDSLMLLPMSACRAREHSEMAIDSR